MDAHEMLHSLDDHLFSAVHEERRAAELERLQDRGQRPAGVPWADFGGRKLDMKELKHSLVRSIDAVRGSVDLDVDEQKGLCGHSETIIDASGRQHKSVCVRPLKGLAAYWE